MPVGLGMAVQLATSICIHSSTTRSIPACQTLDDYKEGVTFGWSPLQPQVVCLLSYGQGLVIGIPYNLMVKLSASHTAV